MMPAYRFGTTWLTPLPTGGGAVPVTDPEYLGGRYRRVFAIHSLEAFRPRHGAYLIPGDYDSTIKCRHRPV